MKLSEKIIFQKLCSTDINEDTVKQISELTSQLCGKPRTVTAEQLQQTTDNHYLLTAQRVSNKESEIIGMACLVTMSLPQGTRQLIESVVVHSDWRNQGIGQSLVETLLKEVSISDAPHTNLTCNSKRKPACSLYKKIGFELAETSLLRIESK